MKRRDVLKAAAAIGAAKAGSAAAQAGLGFTGVLGGISNGIGPPPACLSFTEIGTCYALYIPIGKIIQHWLPVSLVEVIRSNDDSVFGSSSSGAEGDAAGDGQHVSHSPKAAGRVRNIESQKHKFEVRIWGIDDDIRDALTMGKSDDPCWVRDQNANNSMSTSSFMNELLNALNDVSSEVCPSKSDAYTSKMQMQVAGSVLPLLYDSGMDKSEWRYACRDTASAVLATPLTMTTCLGDLTYADVNFEYFCVGDWGPLLPRQMLAAGTSEPVSAALTAYRALHLAHNDIGTFKPAVNRMGMLQSVYPNYGMCIHPGTIALAAEQAIGKPLDGKYAFFYWAGPFSKCVLYDDFYSCEGKGSYG